MDEQNAATDILHTKLHRPPVPNDLVVRQHLIDVLNKNINLPFTLVSAPAGYGKSTLISSWLEDCQIPSCWISLDEFDNDLRQFYQYLVAAISKLHPDACKTARSLLRLAEIPSAPVLARQLLNGLEPVRGQFIVVLDDYHFIKENSVTRLLEELLRHPHPSLHLVLASRRDPALPLMSYRSKGHIYEVRVNDLRFSTKETDVFLSKFLRNPLNEEHLKLLDQKTEGWPTGLRLTALTLKSSDNLPEAVEYLPDGSMLVLDYIVSEVIEQQSETLQNWLISCSILGRFCASLCEAVCTNGRDDINGETFIQQIAASNLFLVPLDTNGTWYRFHHLFRKMLQDQLELRFSPDQKGMLYRKAGAWFAEHEYMDEALHFLLAAGDTEAAAQTICRFRYQLMNKEQWHRLVDWLVLLPQNIIEQNPELLLLKIRLFDKGTPVADCRRYLTIVEAMIEGSGAARSPELEHLIAEFHSYKAWFYYLDGDGEKAVSYAQKSLRGLDPKALSVRGTSTVILAMSLQMMGNLDEAYEAIYDAFEKGINTEATLHSKLLTALCFVHWISGNNEGITQVSKELLKLGTEHELPEAISSAHYFLGQTYYTMDELPNAEQEFKSVIDTQFMANIWDYIHSAFGLALIYNCQGKNQEAIEVAENIMSLGIDRSNKDIIHLAQAFKSELSLRSSDPPSSRQWSSTYAPYPLNPGHRSYIPQLTYVRSLLELSSEKKVDEAEDLLSELHDYCVKIHNRKYLVDVLLLQSLMFYRQDASSKALQKLGEAMTIAEQGRIYRPFLDLGVPMFDLIDQLTGNSQVSHFVSNLRQKCELHNESSLSQHNENGQALILPIESEEGYHLTLREVELLKLLANGMSNGEIAEQLFISIVTVKKHLSNIYKKLDVKNRAQAVRKVTTERLL